MNVKKQLKNLFTSEEHQRIDAAIAAIKGDTAADLCVVVTPASDRYPLYPIMWASIAAIRSALL